MITACTPPSITTQPQDVTVNAGSSIALNVLADGTAPLSYQWFDAAGNAIPNATSSALVVTPQANQSYFVRITNPCGTIQSNTVTVTVLCTPPSITAEPQDASINAGASVTLTVGAAGSAPLSYQWFDGSGNPITNATSSSLTVAPLSNATYFAAATNACGSVHTRTATVTVTCVPPSITSQPQPQTITAGNSATLSVAASGPGPITITWFTADGTAIGTGASIVVTPSSTTSYFARAANNCASATSNLVTVTVNAACIAPQITTQPQDATINQGSTATIHVAASGDPTMQYELHAASTGALQQSNTTGTFTVGPIQTLSFYVIASNGCGFVQSRTFTVTVNCIPPQITSQPPPSVTITAGQIVTLSVNATGSLLHIQWYEQFPTDAFPHAVVNGVDTLTLTVGGFDTPTGTIYTAKAFNGCGSVTSNGTVLNIQ